MRNLLGRKEYLEMELNEGFKDTFVKGFNKIKSWFKLGIKKIKNLIVAFDGSGKILPVVTPHALVDHYSNVEGAQAFASKDLANEIEIAGGNKVSDKAHYDNDNEIYSYCPKFSSNKEMVDWFKNKKFEDSIEYKNFISLLKVNENTDYNNIDELYEDLDSVYKERKKYTDDTDIEGIKQITYAQFENFLSKRLKAYASDSKFKPGNMLVFGAPGIGKSTIPNNICKVWNENNNERVSLITIDTQTIQPGDLMMPEIPAGKSVLEVIKSRNNGEYDSLMKNNSKLANKLNSIYQNKSKFMAPEWLPAYLVTNDPEVDEYLDDVANGSIYDEEGKCIKKGNGGFLFFDELLRADPMIFHQTMNLFSKSRTMNGWRLGSKWSLIACTNRPADSDKVKEVWREMVGDGALADRFPYKYFLLPDVDSWRNWAETYINADKLILDYIFDEDTEIDGEYPRWHTFSPVEADNKLVNSVSPRKWEEAIIAINAEKEMNDYESIADMDKSEIIDCISGLFDEEFLDDFATWIEDHVGNVTIDQIIENPTKVKPRRSAKTDDVVIIRDIYSQVEKAHNEGRDFTDDEMKNIILWFGLNFPTMANAVETDFVQFLDKLVDVDKVLETYHESLRIFNSAYPSKEVLQMMKEDEEFAEYLDYDKLKELCEKYFQHNLKDGEIIAYNELED